MPFDDEFESITDDIQAEYNCSSEAKLARKQYLPLDLTAVYERDLSSFSDEQKSKALERYKLISVVAKEITGGWTPKNIDPLIDKYSAQFSINRPSYKTVIRWYKSFCESDGNIVSLVEHHYKKGNRTKRIIDDEAFFVEATERFLDAKRPSYSQAYQFYMDRIEIENSNIISGKISIVSYQAFKERLKKLPPYEVALKRFGQNYANKLFNYYQSSVLTTRILERVEIDHTPLDLILLDDDLLIPLGRAYLTLLVDVFSGCIIGFHLGFNPPSYISVAKATIHSIKSKEYVHDLNIGLTNDWLCHGKMETLVVDNGAEFWSKSLDQACMEAGVNVEYCKVGQPWEKPRVERKFLEVIQGIVGWVPGKTFSNILEKDRYDPQKDAVMRFSVFVEELHRWIIDVHNASPNSRFTKIPNYHWKKSEETLPPVALSDRDEKQFRIIMGVLHKGVVTTKGIKYKHLMYDNVALEQYRKQYPQTKESRKKTIKIDPDNLSSIFVYLEEIGGYIEIPCNYDPLGYTKNLSLSEHVRIIKIHREFIKGQVDALSLAKARQALHERIKSEQEHLSLISVEGRAKKAKHGKKMAALAGLSNEQPKSIQNALESKKMPLDDNLDEHTPVDNLKSLWNKRKAIKRSKR
ncbi:integrase [Vibrio rumoiensis 1S-45]|uniref:Integrase n=2 Tax=Vibrionaceae TaxID=641 RepID=A0A1E5E2G8_9VIBR|nr:transposase family protein [Vibrio sp. S17_S38]OEF25679.1 integrase [Vibrio rumoiensis 1S-45]